MAGTRLHVDIKGPFVNSLGGKRYAIFFIDEATRYVWVEFMTYKSEAIAATSRVIARFNAEVGVPVDDDGKPQDRPRVLELRRDHEGKYESHEFRTFREANALHETCSPPHDHDLNPIAESIIRVIDANATAARSFSGGNASF